DGRLTADVAMQPFSPADAVLWERVREREPSSWEAYDEFTAWILADLVDGVTWTIEGRRYEGEKEFFRQEQYRGARILRAVATLPAPFVYPLALNLNDSWKLAGTGYIDRIRVEYPAGWSARIASEPEGNSGRLIADRGWVVLRNADANGPKSLR